MDNKKRFLGAVTGLRALVILLGFLTMTLTDFAVPPIILLRLVTYLAVFGLLQQMARRVRFPNASRWRYNYHRR